jgi:hypothetical protein
MLLFAMRGHVHPIGRSGRRGWGVLVAHCLARGLHVSLGRGGSKPWGSGTFNDTAEAQARWRDVARGAHLARDLSARLGQDGVCRSCHKRLTRCSLFW